MSPVRSASHVSGRYRGGAARKSACATAVSEGCIGSRIRTVDAVRGAVMILMALDHGDFIHWAAMSFSPTDLAHTTAAIFLTRWVTHFCAPVFAFKAGMGAFLWVRRNRTTAQLSRFLLTRGLWLIVLELTVLRFILYLNIVFHNTRIVLLVIWMLGASMVVLAALVHLPTRWLAAVSIAIIASHNLLDPVAAARFGPARWAWDILHQQAIFRVDGDSGVSIMVAYPLIPWVAVMAARYCFGPVLLWEPTRRQRFLVRLGIALDCPEHSVRSASDVESLRRSGRLVCSALHAFHYALVPELHEVPSIAGVSSDDDGAGSGRHGMAGARAPVFHDPAIVFGRVPFFFYLVHLAVIQAVSIVLGFVRYGNASFLWMPAPSMGGPRQMFPPGYGYDLWVVYTVWLGVIVALYLVCRWYARLKQRRRDWWLSYLEPWLSITESLGRIFDPAIQTNKLIAIDRDTGMLGGMHASMDVVRANFEDVTVSGDVVYFEFCQHEMDDLRKALSHASTLVPDIVVFDHLPGSEWVFCGAEEDKVRRSAEAMERFGVRRRETFRTEQCFRDHAGLLAKVTVQGATAIRESAPLRSRLCKPSRARQLAVHLPNPQRPLGRRVEFSRCGK